MESNSRQTMDEMDERLRAMVGQPERDVWAEMRLCREIEAEE
jgi:hypothetical protein